MSGVQEELIAWDDFDKLHVVRKIKEIVGRIWKVQVHFTDKKGYLRGVSPGKFFNPLHLVCKRLASNQTGFRGCMEAVRATALIKGKKPAFSRCHAGFSTLSVPIVIKGKLVGTVFCDGFLEEETQREQTELIKQRMRILFPNEQDLEKIVDEVPILAKKDIEFLVELIESVLGEIAEVHAKVLDSSKKIESLESELSSRYSLGNMVGKSSAMQHLYSLIDRVKDSGAIVLIQGENGTGKELIARSLHYNSKRSKGPFVAINCGAFNENLLESELFGHLKGSFTGAIKDKTGLFEAAKDGTLFLDEVGEMPHAMQVKLLRVLQEGSFFPVGSSELRKTNARVICATNADLEKMSEEGLFRKDLFYRLNVINIYIPPLRERREDIPLLIEHFGKQFADSMQVKVKAPSRECLKALLEYSWPGNIRELENEMERLYVLAGDEEGLQETNLSARLRRSVGQRISSDSQVTLKQMMDQTEAEDRKSVV